VTVTYGAEYLAPVARRWKTQLNENAKAWAFYEEFSELNHNAIVGYEHPTEFLKTAHVIVLDGSHLSTRMRTRMDVTEHLMDRYGVSHERCVAPTGGLLAETVSLVALGDYVSYYLALINHADPTVIDPINHLKHALAST
jgi:glucose/mannose-6-phosphate isomerase